MKKLLMIGLAALLLAGCTAKETVKVFEKTEEEPGYKYTYVETITAAKDAVVKEKIIIVHTLQKMV